MELKKSQSLVADMLELCLQSGDPILMEHVSGIYNDVQIARSVEIVVSYAREVMVFVCETPWDEMECPELKDEIETIFNNLLEEYEEY